MAYPDTYRVQRDWSGKWWIVTQQTPRGTWTPVGGQHRTESAAQKHLARELARLPEPPQSPEEAQQVADAVKIVANRLKEGG